MWHPASVASFARKTQEMQLAIDLWSSPGASLFSIRSASIELSFGAYDTWSETGAALKGYGKRKKLSAVLQCLTSTTDAEKTSFLARKTPRERRHERGEAAVHLTSLLEITRQAARGIDMGRTLRVRHFLKASL